MSLRPDRNRRRDDINIVPLVDVLIVLIFFFLVSMQFRTMHTLNLIPPKLETADKHQVRGEVEVSISDEGIFYFNGEEKSRDELIAILEATARVDNKTTILLVADEDSLIKNSVFLIDICRKNDLHQVKLQARK